jgi:diaminobutyrate-2-oxoglutarate transaminase
MPQEKKMSITTLAKNDAVFTRRESSVRSYCRRLDAVFDKATGSVVTDESGRQYVDFLAGCASLNYGHNDPDMKQALLDHIGRDGIAHGLDLFTTAKRRFLEDFEALILTPRNLDYRVQFTGPTGANAVEAALKLARKVTGRNNVVAFTNGFHGVTQGALAATGNRYNRMAPALQLNGVSRLPFDGYLGKDVNTAEILERMLNDPSSGLDSPAAILLETVQGEGGLNAASPSWLRQIAHLAQLHGALLIVDDIQAGCGRTGTFFSFEESGITPDIVCLSKSISGFGLPMALTLFRPELDLWSPGEHNGTFRGHNPAFVTATAALEHYWRDGRFAAGVAVLADQLHDGLARIAAATEGSVVRGRGLLAGVYYADPTAAHRIAAEAFQRGLLVETSGPRSEVVKTMPALTTSAEDLARGLDILADAAGHVTGAAVTLTSVA